MTILAGLLAINGLPFIRLPNNSVDIGAYPISGDTPAGGRIVGRTFTKKDAERELARIYEEDRLESEDREELYRGVIAERGLSTMQRAERDLKLAEAHCVDCKTAFERNPLKLNHDRLVDSETRRDQLAERIEELHDQERLDRISKGEKITDPKIARQISAAREELMKLQRTKGSRQRIDQLNTEIYRLRLMANG